MIVWRYQGQWDPVTELELYESHLPIVQIAWGGKGNQRGFLACASSQPQVPPAMVTESKLHHCMSVRTAAFQVYKDVEVEVKAILISLKVAPDRIVLETFKGPAPTSLQTKIHIRGMSLSNVGNTSASHTTTSGSSSSVSSTAVSGNGFLAVSSGQKIEIYQIKEVI